MADTLAQAAAAKAKPAAKAKTAPKARAKPAPAPLFAGGAENGLTEKNAVAAAERAFALLAAVRENLSKVIFGQEAVVEQVLTAVLAGGHALLAGVPGLAKTRLAESLGAVLGLDEKRIQFTPDLMPADIIGSEVLEEDAKGKRSFRYIRGPVFTQLLMADEINRAGPRTQAALLQAMQEYQVTIAGKAYQLPRPFHVLATQNPLEQEGTYPLPEAQLDRFLLQINLSYPNREAEKRIVLATAGGNPPPLQTVLNAERLMEMQALVRAMPMPENVLDAILNLVRACRPKTEEDEGGQPDISGSAGKGGKMPKKDLTAYIAWGPGPRAMQALALCARARALLQGRFAPSAADVRALAGPVLRHRMALNFTAKAENIKLAAIIEQLAAEFC